MKQKKLLFLLLVIAFLQVSVFAQGKLFSQPKHFLLSGEKLVENEEDYRRLLREKFYPIGWSKDGKFAYLTEPADEACGCYFAEIFIVDLRTDKVLWSERYTSEGETKPDDLKDYWRKNQKRFSNKLNQYKIIQSKTFAILTESFTSKTDSFKVDLFSDVKLSDDAYSSDGKVEIKLISSQKGAKTLYQQVYQGENYKGIMGAEIGTILRSPFEDRIAVVLSQTQRGWEGPPHITRISIIGADLNKGFK